MENKINISELLRDCPKDMELDCVMYEDVYFDYVDELNIIHCYIKYEKFKTSITFNQHGTPHNDIKSKCVIFPKGKTTWEGFISPCKFKDGDIIYNQGIKATAIFYKQTNDNTISHCFLNVFKELKICHYHSKFLYDWRLAAEEEKQKLFDAIKANGYKWNPETKALEKLIEPKFKVGDIVRCINNIDNKFKIIEIVDNYYICENNFRIYFKFQEYWELVPNKFDISKLKPFNKVLVRTDPYAPIWTIDFYDGYNPNAGIKDRPFGVSGGKYFQQCIPYEGNEHLRGTTNECDKFFKVWEK